jgi:ATP-dependent protease ClpP protease subunit
LEIKEPRVYSRTNSKVLSHIYLSGDIGPPEKYIEEMQTFREAEEGDEILIFINSGGGYVSTAIQYVNCIRNCKAKVTAVLEGECHSAATYIFLACDSWEVNMGVIMLIHNYFGGATGKGKDLMDHVYANNSWVKNIMQTAYAGFLTQKEIDQVNKNQDIWLESEEIVKRLATLAEVRNAAALLEEEEAHKLILEQVKELTKDEDREDS